MSYDHAALLRRIEAGERLAEGEVRYMAMRPALRVHMRECYGFEPNEQQLQAGFAVMDAHWDDERTPWEKIEAAMLSPSNDLATRS